MTDFADRMREDARLILLRTLAQDADYQINERMLGGALTSMGHDMSADALRGEIDWLADAGLLTFETYSGLRVVEITPRGLDVAAGRARYTGVARPRPGDVHL